MQPSFQFAYAGNVVIRVIGSVIGGWQNDCQTIALTEYYCFVVSLVGLSLWSLCFFLCLQMMLSTVCLLLALCVVYIVSN